MCLLDLKNENLCVIKTMSGKTQIAGSFKRCVLTGVRREPAWSELSGQLQCLKYAEETSGTFAVVARAAELKLVTARADMYAGKLVLSSSEQSVLEQSVRQAQDEEKVAKARLSLARAERKAAQCRDDSEV